MKKTLLLASVAMISEGFLAAPAKAQGVPQTVEITKVDVQKAAGYRASQVLVAPSSTMRTRQSARLTTSSGHVTARSHTLFCRSVAFWAWVRLPAFQYSKVVRSAAV